MTNKKLAHYIFNFASCCSPFGETLGKRFGLGGVGAHKSFDISRVVIATGSNGRDHSKTPKNPLHFI